LREMVADRDVHIATVKRKTEELDEKDHRLRQGLDDVQRILADERIAYATTKTELLQDKCRATERLFQLQHDLEAQGASLHTFAGLVQRQEMADPSYVMRMQAQLCKGMHSMGIVATQFELAQKHNDSMVKFQKDNLSKITEEKSSFEIELLNDLMKADTEKREVEDELNSRRDEIRKEIENIEKQIEENEDSEDDYSEEEEAEDDEEEEEAKKELMKILQGRKDEIVNLEAAIEQQKETIEELEAQAAEMDEDDNDDSQGALENGSSPHNGVVSEKLVDDEKYESENEEDEDEGSSESETETSPASVEENASDNAKEPSTAPENEESSEVEASDCDGKDEEPGVVTDGGDNDEAEKSDSESNETEQLPTNEVTIDDDKESPATDEETKEVKEADEEPSEDEAEKS